MHLYNLAQARECLFEKTALALDSESSPSLELETCLELAQEAAHLSCTYDEVLISVADCIPYTWVCLMQVTGVTKGVMEFLTTYRDGHL